MTANSTTMQPGMHLCILGRSESYNKKVTNSVLPAMHMLALISFKTSPKKVNYLFKTSVRMDMHVFSD